MKVPYYKATQLNKKRIREQTTWIMFVKLKAHQKEPILMSEITVEGNMEVRKPQTHQARLWLMYRHATAHGQEWGTKKPFCGLNSLYFSFPLLGWLQFQRFA